MAYVRKTKNAAELSALRSLAAKSRKHNRGGRPLGSRNDPATKAIPTRSLTVREPDYQVFRKYAFVNGTTIAEATHRIARAVVAKHPDFKPEGWVD